MAKIARISLYCSRKIFVFLTRILVKIHQKGRDFFILQISLNGKVAKPIEL